MSKKNTKVTRMATEAEAEACAPPQPSTAMIALFNSPVDTSKLERRNLPMMYKPGEVPVDGIVIGEILKVVDSPVSTVKGKLLWLKHENGTEFLFPCTGVIRNALAPGVEGQAELQKALDKEVGKIFIAKRLANKQNMKYKKDMFMFDVYTSNK